MASVVVVVVDLVAVNVVVVVANVVVVNDVLTLLVVTDHILFSSSQ